MEENQERFEKEIENKNKEITNAEQEIKLKISALCQYFCPGDSLEMENFVYFTKTEDAQELIEGILNCETTAHWNENNENTNDCGTDADNN